jgi:capsular polysaccharide biosynthesis protein
MWPHFVNLLHRTGQYFLASLGTTKLDWFVENVVLFLATLGVTLLVVRVFRGRAAMTSHAQENLLIGLIVYVVVSIGLWGTLFMRSFIHTTFDDHMALGAKIAELKKKNNQLLSASEVPQLKTALKQAQADAQRWQDSYQRIASHEVAPDRILSSQQIAALYDELQLVRTYATNDEIISIEIGGSSCQEASHLAYQIFQVFSSAHWRAKFKPNMGGDLKAAYKNFQTFGISIWSDQPNNRGVFLKSALRGAGLESEVNPFPLPPGFKGTVIWVEEKQLFPMDMK